MSGLPSHHPSENFELRWRATKPSKRILKFVWRARKASRRLCRKIRGLPSPRLDFEVHAGASKAFGKIRFRLSRTRGESKSAPVESSCSNRARASPTRAAQGGFPASEAKVGKIESSNQGTAFNTEALPDEAFARVKPELDALKVEEFLQVNLDVTAAVTTILGLLPEVKALREQMVKRLPDFDIAAFDKLLSGAPAQTWERADAGSVCAIARGATEGGAARNDGPHGWDHDGL